MFHARVQFDLSADRAPEPLSFGFFFRPILPLLSECYWICDFWDFSFPYPEGAHASIHQIDGITQPNSVLPRFADQLFFDRQSLYGFSHSPISPFELQNQLTHASQDDEIAFQKLRQQNQRKPGSQEDYEKWFADIREFVTQNGTNLERVLENCGVEIALMTNDGVWWISSRKIEAVSSLAEYANLIPGMSFRETAAFGL